MYLLHYVFIGTIALLTLTVFNPHATAQPLPFIPDDGKSWLAGDHHIHGKFSAKWDYTSQPPTAILFGDAHYFTALNARMAAFHGLDWMVTTDHGGPGHSNVNLEQAYPELIKSRAAVPQIMQFYGMEFDTPGARHSTLIIPKGDNEAKQLFEIESQYNRREIYPDETPRDSLPFMLNALKAMQAMTPRPLLSVNHPARKATGLDDFQKVTPHVMRQWQDAAPNVVNGMTAIPGHQAATLNPDNTLNTKAPRAEYFEYPTHGGADQMSAIVGGVWDKLLSEGRRWTTTAVSDSHAHYTEGRTDFWPGEYAKTYVRAAHNYQSVLEGLRSGAVFVTTGDLIDELYVQVQGENSKAHMGDKLEVRKGETLSVTVAFHQPDTANFHQDTPNVRRLDIIYGEITGTYTNEPAPTQVVRRFYPENWEKHGQYQLATFTIPAPKAGGYLRVRGTNKKDELEPHKDPAGENPWSDLWFYSNPVYLSTVQ